MRPFRLKHTALALVLGSLALAACGTEPPPPEPEVPEPPIPPSSNALKLSVGVRLDPNFRSNGEFVLELFPSDASGTLLVGDQWTASSTFYRPAGTTGALVSQQVGTGSNQSNAVAIDIDDSGSMQDNDPQRERRNAAQAFWRTLLPQSPSNEVALFDFGVSAPSTGFARTRMIQALTNDTAQLNAVADSIHHFNGTSSPLYHSVLEVGRWLAPQATGDMRKAVIVITDGLPNQDEQYRDSVITEMQRLNVRVYSVGIGPASDRNANKDQDAVNIVRDLANKTGGLYAGVENNTDMTAILQAFAAAAGSGALEVRFKLGAVPPRGYTVGGIVTLTGPDGTVSAPWTFISPQ